MSTYTALFDQHSADLRDLLNTLNEMATRADAGELVSEALAQASAVAIMIDGLSILATKPVSLDGVRPHDGCVQTCMRLFGTELRRHIHELESSIEKAGSQLSHAVEDFRQRMQDRLDGLSVRTLSSTLLPHLARLNAANSLFFLAKTLMGLLEGTAALLAAARTDLVLEAVRLSLCVPNQRQPVKQSPDP